MSQNVRARFAPSPTGYLHVGGMRTALFAWLVARQNNGQFILRIEDTDQKRRVEGADRHIAECLDWLGLNSDEGPIYQSERVKAGIYRQWAEKLVATGRAYADPYSSEEVQKFREQAITSKQPFLYRNHRPENLAYRQAGPPAWDGKKPLRFKSDPKSYKTTDAVMGELSTGMEAIDDFILIKSDGYPTYNFAHIIDDIEMEITHVIRGQEFLSSIPNYLNLYEALAEQPPIFATVPHILNEQGNKKLSKRDGAKDVLDYIRDGFLPEALVSFIATLGWNDGTTQEVFTEKELLDKFSLDRVQKSGARFDEQRLSWVNGHFIRELTLDDLYKRVKDYWPGEASKTDEVYKKKVLAIVQERLKYLAELPELTNFFFKDLPPKPELITEHKQLKNLTRNILVKLMEQAKATLEQSDFSVEDLTGQLNKLLEETGQKPVILFSLIRIAITQAPASPGLADTLGALGKDRSLARIKKQIEELQ